MNGAGCTKIDLWLNVPDSHAFPEDNVGVRFATIENVAPLDAQIGRFPKKTVPDTLHDVLFKPLPSQRTKIRATVGDPVSEGPQRTYAILDAAKVDNLPELLECCGLEYRCLFKGDAYNEMKSVAPWLVRLEDGNSFTANLFTRSDAYWHLWDNEAGIYVRSHGSLDDLWGHFRKFTRVQDAAGKWYYFRLWEPRWTLSIVRSMSAADSESFLPGIDGFVALDSRGKADVIFT